MTVETLMREEIIEGGFEGGEGRTIQWSSVFAGALAAGAMSFILVGFGVAVGLGVSSASPTWRDASVALALLSGLYLIIQAIISFGFGGYIAGRTARPAPAMAASEDDGERRDGVHGLILGQQSGGEPMHTENLGDHDERFHQQAADVTALVVVGDDDQSIYGFRGGKVEHLVKFREYMDTLGVEIKVYAAIIRQPPNFSETIGATTEWITGPNNLGAALSMH